MSALNDIRTAYTALEAEIAAIDAKAAPIIAKGKKVNEAVMALQAELRAISEELKPYRGEDYLAKRKALGQLALALGGKGLKAEPPK